MSSKARNAEKRREREAALMAPPVVEEEPIHWQLARSAIDETAFTPAQIAALNSMLDSLKDALG